MKHAGLAALFLGVAITATTFPSDDAGIPWLAPDTQQLVQTANDKTAIVVFTGDDKRIAEGLRLYMEGAAPRLLISGIEVAGDDVEKLATRLGVPVTRPLDGIDLDPLARDTHGNAVNTAQWVRDKNIGRVILVTSDYHMPRSWFLLSTKDVMRTVDMVARPVKSGAPREIFNLERQKLLAARLGLTTRAQYRILFS